MSITISQVVLDFIQTHGTRDSVHAHFKLGHLHWKNVYVV